jgi:hypothetical protein
MTFTEKQDIVLEITDDVLDGTEEIENSEMKEPFDPNQINIIPKQDSLSNLIERLKNNEIDMNTEFQRHADLWGADKMSRFIESILIRFPIPSLYFDASDDNNWLIVDGLQRLSTIRKFVVENELLLKDMEYLQDLNGSDYKTLPRVYQRRINECPVTLFILQQGTPEEVKYSIFRRINTGGLVLNNQEIRFAMASNYLREFLKKLAQNEYLVKTVGDQSKRMMDQELVLRFLAFSEMDYNETYKVKNITTFLDEMMKRMKEADNNELLRLENSYIMAMKRCWEIFGEEAFEKRIDDGGNRRKRKNSTLFEVWTVALAKQNNSEITTLIKNKNLLISKHLKLMGEDNDYFRSITYSTQKRDHFRIRRDKVNQIIKEVLNA